MAYAIFHTHHQEYFVGFDINDDAAWGKESDARTWDTRLHAETQALLLAQDDADVQRMAIAINK